MKGNFMTSHLTVDKSINNVAKHFSQVASKRKGKQTRCFNLNSIYRVSQKNVPAIIGMSMII